MHSKITNLLKQLKWWIKEMGVPVLILASMVAALAVVAHEFDAGPPLESVIRKDLKHSDLAAQPPEQPAQAESTH
jgi:hypothetical protein